MKKIIALFLIFSLTIPQTFAQIDFGSSKLSQQIVSGKPNKSEMRQNVLLHHLSGMVLQNSKVALVTISILSAAMYPAMTGYYERSRDVNRIARLKNLSVGLLAYNMDNSSYPPEQPSGCFPYGYLLSPVPYVRENMDSSDPKKNFMHDGCNDKNAKAPFAYRVIKDENNEERVILSANMENEKGGNSPYSIDEIVKNPKLLEKIESRELKGKYYILSQ